MLWSVLPSVFLSGAIVLLEAFRTGGSIRHAGVLFFLRIRLGAGPAVPIQKCFVR